MTDLSTLQIRLPEVRLAASKLSPDDLKQCSASERMRFTQNLHWCIDTLRELELRLKVGLVDAGRRRRPF